MYVCMCVSASVDPLERLNELTDFHKTWYGTNVVGGNFNAAIFNFLQSAVKAWRTCELERQHHTHKTPVASCAIRQLESHKPCGSYSRSHVTAATTLADAYWHLHRSDCRNTPIHAHTTSRILPTRDVSLGSPMLPAPEPGDFVEYILL
jgi:hypothetical protein